MTPAQEQKLDKLYEATLRMEGRFNVIDEKISTHRELILEHEGNHIEINKRLGGLEADKNKVVGALWLTGTGFFAAVGTFVLSFFYKD